MWNEFKTFIALMCVVLSIGLMAACTFAFLLPIYGEGKSMIIMNVGIAVNILGASYLAHHLGKTEDN